MKSDNILKKADIALQVLLEHDERDSNCSFKQLMSEIIDKWNNEEKNELISNFSRSEINSRNKPQSDVFAR